MAKEVEVKVYRSKETLIGEVIKEDYDDPYVQDFGLAIGKNEPLDLRWFQILTEQIAVREALNKYAFIDVHFDRTQDNPEPGTVINPLYNYADADPLFGDRHKWEILPTGEKYDPTVLVPHSDADHIALIAARGQVRKTATGVIGRKLGVTATVQSIEEFLDESGWYQPFKDVAAKHLNPLKELANSPEKLSPEYDHPWLDTLIRVYSDFLMDQSDPEVGIRQNPEANICYARLNELVATHLEPEDFYQGQWNANILRLIGHVGLHWRILDGRENLIENTGLARKSGLSYLSF